MSHRPSHEPALRTTIHWSHRDSAKVGLIMTADRGLALIASQRILPGEKLMAFDGEIHHWGDSTRNLSNEPPLFLRDHCIQIGEGVSRDSTGLARYANHSCDPNCGITDRNWITAMREIAPGTELTWDYAMTEDNDWQMPCGCGAPDCLKRIAGYRHLPPHRREAYKGFISSWLTDLPRPFLGPAVLPLPAPLAQAG